MPFHNYVIEIISAQSVFSDTSNYDYSMKKLCHTGCIGKVSLWCVFFFTCIKKLFFIKYILPWLYWNSISLVCVCMSSIRFGQICAFCDWWTNTVSRIVPHVARIVPHVARYSASRRPVRVGTFDLLWWFCAILTLMNGQNQRLSPRETQ